jgi:phage gp46-like protein
VKDERERDMGGRGWGVRYANGAKLFFIQRQKHMKQVEIE